MKTEPSSFRDNSGFIFHDDIHVYRAIRESYRRDYDLLMSSGLYKDLVSKTLLISHEECDIDAVTLPEASADDVFKIIRPEKVRFISYPYEWSFSQLKDAALTTLEIARESFRYGMVLKDASAYNIQFVKGRPVFIDTLSFESYEAGSPWVAYHQFCKHFLAPLSLMSYVDASLGHLLKHHIDGIPVQLASRLLPCKARFSSLFLHIFLHSRQQDKYNESTSPEVLQKTRRQMSKNGFLGILANLESCIRKLQIHGSKTEWGEYYRNTNYSEASSGEKARIVEQCIQQANPESVLDMGANSGPYSRIASAKNIFTISADVDPVAVDANYRKVRDRNECDLLPLVIDLTSPSPSIGWSNDERASFFSRIPENCTMMALALIHHLAISNNVPLRKIADLFSEKASFLIIEFVPKTDSQVRKLLATRKDIFDDYTVEGFEEVFSQYFTIIRKEAVQGSERFIYLMSRKRLSGSPLSRG
jgi:hypothetical protein